MIQVLNAQNYSNNTYNFRGGDKVGDVLVQVFAAAERVLHVQEVGLRRHHSGNQKVQGANATGK